MLARRRFASAYHGIVEEVLLKNRFCFFVLFFKFKLKTRLEQRERAQPFRTAPPAVGVAASGARSLR